MGLIKNLTAAIERLAVAMEEGNSRPDPSINLIGQWIEHRKKEALLCPACRGGGFLGEYRKVEETGNMEVAKVQCPVCDGTGRVKVRNTEED